MPPSEATLAQMQAIGSELDPLAAQYASAPQFFERGLNEAFGYNLPLLKEAAGLEAGAYALPGQLMNQYSQDYGGMTSGPSAMTRLNSILGRIGTQFGMADVASELAQQRGADIKDIARSLQESYGLGLGALEDRYGRLAPLYQTQVGVEEAGRGREFARGERLGGQEFTRGERLSGQEFLAGESAADRVARSASDASGALQFQRLVDQYMQQLEDAAITDNFVPYPARIPSPTAVTPQTSGDDFMQSTLGQQLPGIGSRNQFLRSQYSPDNYLNKSSYGVSR